MLDGGWSYIPIEQETSFHEQARLSLEDEVSQQINAFSPEDAMPSYSIERVVKWKTLTRKWQRLLRGRIEEGKWPLKRYQDEILYLTMYEYSDSQIAERTQRSEYEIRSERYKAVLKLLRVYKEAALCYPELPEVLNSVEIKMRLFEACVDKITRGEDHELDEAFREADKQVHGQTIGRLIGYYFEAKGEVYARRSHKFISISGLADLTGYSESQLGYLLRSQNISGEKVDGEWKSTVRAVRDYQRQQGSLGAPRRPRRQPRSSAGGDKRPNTLTTPGR